MNEYRGKWKQNCQFTSHYRLIDADFLSESGTIYIFLRFCRFQSSKTAFHREKIVEEKKSNTDETAKKPERLTLYCLDTTKTNWHWEKRTHRPNCEETPNKWHNEKHKSGSRAGCDSFSTKHGKNIKIKCYLRFKSPNFSLSGKYT